MKFFVNFIYSPLNLETQNESNNYKYLNNK